MKDIQVLGRTVKIKSVSMAELKELYGTDDEEVWGWYNPIELCIYIYSGLDADAYKRVLIHEITHAYITILGLDEVLEDKIEEAYCTLSENMLELFQNKKFVEELNK